MSNAKNPRGAGRKPTIAKDGGRRINVHLDEETVRIARELGNGNLSLGIREAMKIISSHNREIQITDIFSERLNRRVCNDRL